MKKAAIMMATLLALSFLASALIITPDIDFIIGNETYTVNQPMDFSSITISDTYIIFNNTGFYIESSNDILITLIYLNDDIINASNNEKVLEFNANTISGDVCFNISGFPGYKKHIVKKDGVTTWTPFSNDSGHISFKNNVWTSEINIEILTSDIIIYINDVTVYLNATDDKSDVDYTMYRLNHTFDSQYNQNDWTIYTSPLSITEEGTYLIEYYSIDKAGNIEQTKSREFAIFKDNTPPVTTCEIQDQTEW